LGANPGTIADRDRCVAVWHLRLSIIVVSRAKKSALRNATVGTDRDRFQVKDKDLFTDPSEITYR
jgi:hypothetical protein